MDVDIERYTAPWAASWRSARLQFEAGLERRFEAATREFRVRELRLTVSLSAVFYVSTSVTDAVLVPDIGLLGLWLRLITIPIWLFFMVRADGFTGAVREAYLTTLATIAVALIAVIATQSSAPFAPYEFTTGMLTIIYVNTTYPLRFNHAVVCMTLSLAITLALLFGDAAIGTGLAGTIGLLFSVAASYSLISCYRIERGQRLAFLLSFRESQRLVALAADRDAVAVRSNTDALTGLANRGHFDRRLAALLRDHERRDQRLGLLMLDVDFFKRYNDHHGHPAGDAALQQVARIIDQAVRERGDFAARYGGEEFALLLRDVDPAEALLVADRLCGAVRASAITHANRDDRMGVVTVSIGAALAVTTDRAGAAHRNDAAARLVEAADRALYLAKKGGRNRAELAAVDSAPTASDPFPPAPAAR